MRCSSDRSDSSSSSSFVFVQNDDDDDELSRTSEKEEILFELQVHNDQGFSHCRRIPWNQVLDRTGQISHGKLQAWIRKGSIPLFPADSSFSTLDSKKKDWIITISYQDDQGNRVVIGSSPELQHAVTMATTTNKNVLTLQVDAVRSNMDTNNPNKEDAEDTKDPDHGKDSILDKMETRLCDAMTSVLEGTEERLQQTLQDLAQRPTEVLVEGVVVNEPDLLLDYTPTITTTTTTTTTQTRNVVETFISNWNKGDGDALAKQCAPFICLRIGEHWDNSSQAKKVVHEGPLGLAHRVETMHQSLREYRCVVQSMIVENNKAYCRLFHRGVHTGDRSILGFPPSGRDVAWIGAMEFTVKEEKVERLWELGDSNLKVALEAVATCVMENNDTRPVQEAEVAPKKSIPYARRSLRTDLMRRTMSQGTIANSGRPLVVTPKPLRGCRDPPGIKLLAKKKQSKAPVVPWAVRVQSVMEDPTQPEQEQEHPEMAVAVASNEPVNFASRDMLFRGESTERAIAELVTADCQWVKPPTTPLTSCLLRRVVNRRDPPGQVKDLGASSECIHQQKKEEKTQKEVIVGRNDPMSVRENVQGGEEHNGTMERAKSVSGINDKTDKPNASEEDDTVEENNAEVKGTNATVTVPDISPVDRAGDLQTLVNDVSTEDVLTAFLQDCLQSTHERAQTDEVVPMIHDWVKQIEKSNDRMTAIEKSNDRMNGALLNLKDELESQARQMEEWQKTMMASFCKQTKTLKNAILNCNRALTSRVSSLESFCHTLQTKRSGDEHTRLLTKLEQDQAKLREDFKTLVTTPVDRGDEIDAVGDGDDVSNKGSSCSVCSGPPSASVNVSHGSVAPSTVDLKSKLFVPGRLADDSVSARLLNDDLSTESSSGSESTLCKRRNDVHNIPSRVYVANTTPRMLKEVSCWRRRGVAMVDSLILYGLFDENDMVDDSLRNAKLGNKASPMKPLRSRSPRKPIRPKINRVKVSFSPTKFTLMDATHPGGK